MKSMKKEMDEYTKASTIRVFKILHIFITIVMQVICLAYMNNTYNDRGVGHRRFFLVVFVYVISLLSSLRTYKSYDFGLISTGMLAYSQTLADIVANTVFYVIFVIANSTIFNPVPVLILTLVQLVYNILWSVSVNKLYTKIHKLRKTVVFYSGKDNLYHLKEIMDHNKLFSIEKIIEIENHDFDVIKNGIAGCEAIFLSGITAEFRNEILKYAIEEGKNCYIAPSVGDIIMMGSNHMHTFSVPIFKTTRAMPDIEYAFLKRFCDISLSLLGIILTSPLMLITAIAIKAYDKGPAFYKQVRLTKNGEKFEILKFRSMCVNAESDGVARLAGEKDSRITPIGKIIRACRIDELPQLFNILKGDMSIVGPRPERPEIAAQYEEELPDFKLRLQVRAGLTGLAQVYGRYNTEPYYKLQMDLLYINEMSFVNDWRLIFATIKILFVKESTSGTAEGQVTAMVSKKTDTEDENKEKQYR